MRARAWPFVRGARVKARTGGGSQIRADLKKKTSGGPLTCGAASPFSCADASDAAATSGAVAASLDDDDVVVAAAAAAAVCPALVIN